jgi:hypothetical protein
MILMHGVMVMKVLNKQLTMKIFGKHSKKITHLSNTLKNGVYFLCEFFNLLWLDKMYDNLLQHMDPI